MANNNGEKKGSFIGLVPLICFLVVYFIMGIGTGDFGNFPLMIGMFLAMAIALAIKSRVGTHSHSQRKLTSSAKAAETIL